MNYKEIIAKMTLAEKASLFSGKDNWRTKPIERLGVPSLFCADGPHGLRKQEEASDHLGLNPSTKATCFPTGAAVINSWDTALGEAVGRALGEEAAAQGVNILLGPGLNIKRNPLCGRNFEYFSEDPYLAGKMAAGYVRGIQSKGVAACPKHFAVNSQETQRMASDSIIDERTLREIYLTAFEIAVKEAKPLSVMSAYNRINGVYANENEHLLQNILVDEWGFDGIVVSDWGASNDHVEGVRVGAHLEMPAPGAGSDIEIIEAVKNGTLSEEVLNKRVDEFLTVLFNVTKEKAKKAINAETHHALARKAAEGAIVLLKNSGNILPLKSGTNVALIGDFAEKPRYQGAGSSLVNATSVDSALQLFPESGLAFAGYEQGFVRGGGQDDNLLQGAVALAKKADTVLLYLGLDEMRESEGADRLGMALADNQIKLLDEMQRVNPNIVVVLSCGSVIEMPWLPQCKALVYASLLGQAGAGAVLDVITGKTNPSGKIAETYPLSYSDVPGGENFPAREATAEYREGIYVGYRYYEKQNKSVLFPFGFGMSYTRFEYSGLTLSEKNAKFKLKNTGAFEGAEVVQLYIGCKDGKIFRATKELKGFDKISLQPGESKVVTLELDDKAFRYYNVKTKRFEVEEGTYEISIGASSADIRLAGCIKVAGSGAPNPYEHQNLPHYNSGDIKDLPDKEFAALLGRTPPPVLWDRTKPLERNSTFAQLCYAKSHVGRLVYKVLNRLRAKAEKKGTPDLNILFITNMPFRAIGKMTDGAVNMAMVDALVFLFNGHFFRGVGRFVKAFFAKNKAQNFLRKQLEETNE